jgi:N,N'-diacetyllegionaminate synthase|tara:strand:+ start:19 stop:1035 length:1017 start_codon:yes stop_codon:yes gene_type:complete
VNKTFIIAEAGANHNRDISLAKSLIDVAASAGCDAVKFQTYSANTLYASGTPDFAGYENISELIESLELPRDWHALLKEHCDNQGIEFMSTPFDKEAIKELCDVGVSRIKIAGFESTDPRIVKEVARAKLPIIFSAGIGSSVSMARKTVNWIREENPEADITILHCNNAYPTPIMDINLGQIRKLKEIDGVRVGLSDHTEGILVPPLAVAMGATCIEKHFTMSRQLTGPDHPFAIEPRELADMVYHIRLAEIAMQQKEGELTDSEQSFRMAMRSVVASKDIKEGEVYTLDNITTKRPYLPESVPAISYYDVIGRRAAKSIKENEILSWTGTPEGRDVN